MYCLCNVYVFSHFFFLDGYMQVTPVQTPLSVTRPEMKTARMICKVDGVDFSNNPIHWYRQSPGAPPKRILYMTSQSVSMDEGFNSNKFEATRQNDKFTFKLDVHRLTSEDAGTYYCAYWDLFGSGTKLIVTSKLCAEGPKIQILRLPPEQDVNVTYLCLVENFYPNVIKVNWESSEKNVEKNAVYGDIWPSDDNQTSYFVSSWLTIDKSHSKNYNCTYEHEMKKDSFPIESQDCMLLRAVFYCLFLYSY
uniref:Ig-like domain-containing protein n=1 Tax=Pelusios castaneus TaxID=367368 RepID=A0A8C8SV00_9SAUR